MASNSAKALVSDALLTPTSDRKGHEVFICDPPWFDEQKKFKISAAPVRTASLEFSGADLNFLARVLYAEASGSKQLFDANERKNEKSAIMNVNHFRLNRRGYPNNHYVAMTFREVCEAPGQFESVFSVTPKFLEAGRQRGSQLVRYECQDLTEALQAVAAFLATGPDKKYVFDNFRGFNPNGAGTHIGRSRFSLSSTAELAYAKIP